MTVDYDSTEVSRLITEAKAHDAVMSEGWPDEWRADSAVWFMVAQRPENIAGLAWMRRNLRALADQLEAAGREVERRRRRSPPAGCQCTYEQGDSDCSVHPACPACGESLCGTSLTTERNSLRQQLEASQRTQAVHLAQLDGAQANLTDARRDLVAAQRRIAELDETALALQSDVEARGKRVAGLKAELTKARYEHTGDGLAWFEKEHALTMERDALRREVERKDADIGNYRAVNDSLHREVERLTQEHQERSKHVLEVEDAATSAERERDSLISQLDHVRQVSLDSAQACVDEVERGALMLLVAAAYEARRAAEPDIRDEDDEVSP